MASVYYCNNLDILFNKHQCLKGAATANIDDDYFCDPKFLFASIENQQQPSDSLLLKFGQLKDRLNAVKSLTSDKDIGDWHRHTEFTNPAGNVVSDVKRLTKSFLCTQAFCKFYEILIRFPDLLPIMADPINEESSSSPTSFQTLHLCEAPGAFVEALNYYLCQSNNELNAIKCLRSRWRWFASSLNPYYEGTSMSAMVGDDRLILNTISNWLFFTDNIGNLMCTQSLQDLIDRFDGDDYRKCDMVTADGSFSCVDDPAEQERLTYPLHCCEFIAACHVIKRGGSLVLKRFTLFEECSIAMLYLLCCFFKCVDLFKPCTSKMGNSEIYVVCRNFQSPGDEILKVLQSRYGDVCDGNINNCELYSMRTIPDRFIHGLFAIIKFFTQHQIDAIQYNLNLFSKVITEDDRVNIERMRKLASKTYMEKCCIAAGQLRYKQRLVRRSLHIPWFYVTQNPRKVGSFNDRISVNHNQTIQLIAQRVNDLRDQFAVADRIDLKSINLNNDFSNADASSNHDLENSYQTLFQLRYGKGFNKILNSKFCNRILLESILKLQELVKFERKMDKNVESLELEKFDFTSCNAKCQAIEINSLNFDDTFPINYESDQQSSNSLISLVNQLKNLVGFNKEIDDANKNGVIICCSYVLFLTRLTMGILLLLRVGFESITLIRRMNCAVVELKQIISMKRLKFVIEKLESINASCIQLKSSGMTVLEVCSMQIFAEEKEFYESLFRFNNYQLLIIFDLISDNFQLK